MAVENSKIQESKSSLNGSVVKALDILEFLTAVQTPQGAASISKKLQMNKATTYNILRVLESREYIERVSSSKFQVTNKLLTMSTHHVSRMPIVQAIKQCAVPFEGIYEEIRISLGGFGQNNTGVYLYASDPNDGIFPSGSSFPLHATGLGKVLLAYSPAQLDHIRKKKLTKYTTSTITDNSVLLEKIPMVKKLGYALDYGEFFLNYVCCAAPIFGPESEFLAAVSLGVHVDVFSKISKDEFISNTKLLAARTSYAMGYLEEYPV